MLYFCLLELGTLFGRRGLLIMLSRTTSSLLLDLMYLLWGLRLWLQEHLDKFLRQIIVANFERALILDRTALILERLRPFLSKHSPFRTTLSLITCIGSVNGSGVRWYKLSCLLSSMLDILQVLLVHSFGGSLRDLYFEIDWLRVIALAAAQVIGHVWLVDVGRSLPFLVLRIELPLDFLSINVCHELFGIIYLELWICWRIKTHRLPSARILLRLGRVPGMALIISHVRTRNLFR